MGQVGRAASFPLLLTVPSSNPIPIYSKSHDWVAVSNHTSLQLPINMSNYANQSYSDSVQPGPSGSAFPEPDHSAGDDDDGGKKKGAKRRKVNHACLYCRRSHMTCDEGRPCQRW